MADLIDLAKAAARARKALDDAKDSEAAADQDLKDANRAVAKANHDLHQAEQEDAGAEVIKAVRKERVLAFKKQAAAAQAHENAEKAVKAAEKRLGSALRQLISKALSMFW